MTNQNKTFNDNVHYLYSEFTHQYLQEDIGVDFTMASNSKDIFIGTILEEDYDLIQFDHKLKEKTRVSIDGEVVVLQLIKDVILIGTSTGKVYRGPFNALEQIAKFENEITSVVLLNSGLAVAYTSGIAIIDEDGKIAWTLECEAVFLDVFDNRLLFVMDNKPDTNVSVISIDTHDILYTIPLNGEAKSIAIHPKEPLALFCTNSEIQFHDLRSGLLATWKAEENQSYERLKWNPYVATQFFFTTGSQIHLIDLAKIDSEFVDDDCDMGPEFVSSHVTFDNNVSDFAVFPIKGKQKFGVVAIDSEQMQRYAIHPELLE